MSRLSDLLGRTISYKASKSATDLVWMQEDGISVYYLGGMIIAGCGAGWMVLSLIPIICKTPINECIWMWVLAGIQILLGIVLIFLTKRSQKFRTWAVKNFKKGLKERNNLEGKVKFKKITLPMTYGDVLALKIILVLAVIIIVILGIGYLQGWVK